MNPARNLILLSGSLLLLATADAFAESAWAGAGPGQVYLSGACEATLRPDRAVIVGGVSSRSLLPTQADAQLERQLGEIERTVEVEAGVVRMLERVRAIVEYGPRGQNEPVDQPYLLVQRLEIAFPLDVDLDAILERLLPLGLDRYGNDLNIRGYSNDPKIVVRYRFSDFARSLDRARLNCRDALVLEHCSTANAQAFCSADHPEAYFVVEQLSMQSQPVVQSNGDIAPLTVRWPAQGNAPELMGAIDLELSGQISVRAVIEIQ